MGVLSPNGGYDLSTISPKDALRDLLAAKVAEKLQQDPDAVTLYAAERAPDPKRYSKRPTVSEQAFQRELDKMREDKAGNPQSALEAAPVSSTNNVVLDDYPGLR